MKNFLFLILIFGSLYPGAQAQTESPDAAEMYQYAQQYLEQERLNIALQHADAAVKLKNDFIDAYTLRARIREGMGDLKDANTDYTIVLHLDSERSDVRFQRALNYYQMERYPDAAQDFHYLLNHPAGETTTVYFKGKSGPGGFEGNTITTLQSDMRADIFNYLGLIHLAGHSPDSARYYIEQAITRNPNEPDYYVNRGLLHEVNQDTTAAIHDYQRALSYQSDHPNALANLQKIGKGRDYDQMLAEAYDLAVSEQASHQAFFNRAVFHQNNGDHRMAVRDFDRAIAMISTDDEAFMLRAYSKERTSDLEGALSDYSRAIALNPMLAKAYSNRANVYYKLKRYKEAINDYNRAIEFFPEKARLFFNRGLALYLDGQRTDACIDLRKARSMGFVNAGAPIRAYCND